MTLPENYRIHVDLPVRKSEGAGDILSDMASKTNAMRLLDQMGIRYETREYEVDPKDLTAETVAAKVGLPAEQVFKTLAVEGDRNGCALR